LYFCNYVRNLNRRRNEYLEMLRLLLANPILLLSPCAVIHA